MVIALKPYSGKYLGIQREDSGELAWWVGADHSTPALAHGLAGAGVPGALPPQNLALITVSPQGLWGRAGSRHPHQGLASRYRSKQPSGVAGAGSHGLTCYG